MYICNIYIHIHLYYITFTNIFFFKNTHFLPQHFYKNLSPTSLKSNIFLHVFIVLTNQPTKQQPNNNQQPPIPANNNPQHPTTNNNTKHTTPPHQRVDSSYCIFHPGRLPGWSGSEQSRGRLQRNHTWQGGIPPIQLHFPPWEAARVVWIRAIQRQVARKTTPGRVVFLPSNCIFHPGRLPGWSGSEQSRGRLQGKSHLAEWYSSYCILLIPILHKSQFSHIFVCRRAIL